MKSAAYLELGDEKIGILLKRYAIPAIIATTASSLYNIADSIFIGQGIGPYAISGLALTFPFMNLLAAFGTLVGVGFSTSLSIVLGRKEYDTAQKILGNEFLLNLIVGLLFSLMCLIFLNPILYFFGASENTISYAREYMEIILSGSVISTVFMGMNHLLRASGHPKKAMTIMLFTVLINIVLDALFIFVFKAGIRGAAIATVISQLFAFIWLIVIFSDQKRLLHFEKKIFIPDFALIKRALNIGISPFILNLFASIIIIIVNQQLNKYGGDMAVGAYGIVNRITFLFIMIIFGLTQGMQPILGYNYGAGNSQRVLKTLILTATTAVILMSSAFVLTELFPNFIVSFFTADYELAIRASRGLRIVMLTAPLLGFQIVASIFFQNIGFAKKAIFLTLIRQVIFVVPLLYILPLMLDSVGVWWSFVVSDIISTAITIFILNKFIQKIK